MSNANIKTLEKDCKEMLELIDEADAQLAPVDPCSLFPSNGREFIAGIISPGGLLIYKAVGFIGKLLAQQRARKALLETYKELTAKYSMIIDELNRLTTALNNKIQSQDEDLDKLQKRCDALRTLAGRILSYMKKAEEPDPVG